ncbi:hypothetical protein C8F04DRAFT_457417 [Mycena alexandri]|uniref:Uncharacterized protein n=1 Tax=Mycena alexandri TaxID=1745969 RepID=A0AAD6X2V5_9AGAR|nr:hypothetical protein C8F04DRAFT_457417 [Mycena alexandri]
MNTETYPDDGYTSALGPDEFTSSGGGMFAGSQYFTVGGGTFNNTTNNYVAAPAAPPADFRMIPIGDIDLQKELTVNKESWVLGRRRKHNCARRVYSAKIDGRNSNVTVAVYQGDGAEEDWGQDTEMYMSVRHPNIIQICAGASYGNIHATVFHGGAAFNLKCRSRG